MLNKVPEVTLFFWIIKIMCTTVGETAADYLNVNLGFGLTNTTYFTGALLAVLLLAQFRLRRYVPGVYWAVVVVISVFGTLITDNMTDGYNVPLTTSTVVFSVILAAVFGAWYAVERTLSIHTIVTTRREAFYWLAILFTFALGTAAGDLSAEKFGLGYGPSILIFGALIAAVAVAHYGLRLNAVLAFWLAYILTRPLGASIGDWMSQNSKQVRRARPRHHRDELHLPRLHPRAGDLPHHHQARPHRRRGALRAPAAPAPARGLLAGGLSAADVNGGQVGSGSGPPRRHECRLDPPYAGRGDFRGDVRPAPSLPTQRRCRSGLSTACACLSWPGNPAPGGGPGVRACGSSSAPRPNPETNAEPAQHAADPRLRGVRGGDARRRRDAAGPRDADRERSLLHLRGGLGTEAGDPQRHAHVVDAGRERGAAGRGPRVDAASSP